MNMLVTKWACQATSMMNLTAMRVSLLAPQKASTTKSSLPQSCFLASSFTSPHTFSLMGWLSFLYSSLVHHTVSFDWLSITMYLSLGERPV